MKTNRYVFSESFENYEIDDYINSGDDGPWYPVVPAESYQKAVDALKQLVNRDASGRFGCGCSSYAEDVLKELGEIE